jgi:hypothetical protein
MVIDPACFIRDSRCTLYERILGDRVLQSSRIIQAVSIVGNSTIIMIYCGLLGVRRQTSDVRPKKEQPRTGMAVLIFLDEKSKHFGKF